MNNANWCELDDNKTIDRSNKLMEILKMGLIAYLKQFAEFAEFAEGKFMLVEVAC